MMMTLGWKIDILFCCIPFFCRNTTGIMCKFSDLMIRLFFGNKTPKGKLMAVERELFCRQMIIFYRLTTFTEVKSSQVRSDWSFFEVLLGHNRVFVSELKDNMFEVFYGWKAFQ